MSNRAIGGVTTLIVILVICQQFWIITLLSKLFHCFVRVYFKFNVVWNLVFLEKLSDSQINAIMELFELRFIAQRRFIFRRWFIYEATTQARKLAYSIFQDWTISSSFFTFMIFTVWALYSYLQYSYIHSCSLYVFIIFPFISDACCSLGTQCTQIHVPGTKYGSVVFYDSVSIYMTRGNSSNIIGRSWFQRNDEKIEQKSY